MASNENLKSKSIDSIKYTTNEFLLAIFNYFENVPKLSKYLFSESFSDLVFKISYEDNVSYFNAHRIIMAILPDSFLSNLVTNGMKESNQEVIELVDINPLEFQYILGLIYRRTDLKSIPYKSTFEILLTAHGLSLPLNNLMTNLRYLEMKPEFYAYLVAFLIEYYGDLTQESVDLVASKINDYVDLSTLTGETIVQILKSSKFNPKNRSTAELIIRDAVEKGHSSNLLQYIPGPKEEGKIYQSIADLYNHMINQGGARYGWKLNLSKWNGQFVNSWGVTTLVSGSTDDKIYFPGLPVISSSDREGYEKYVKFVRTFKFEDKNPGLKEYINSLSGKYE